MTKEDLYIEINSVLPDHTSYVKVRTVLNKYFNELDNNTHNDANHASSPLNCRIGESFNPELYRERKDGRHPMEGFLKLVKDNKS